MSRTHMVGTNRPRALDPELAALQVMMPRIDVEDYDAARRTEEHIVREMRGTDGAREVDAVDLTCPAPHRRSVSIRMYRPRAASSVGEMLPTLLFIHGGSFVTGGLHSEDSRCERYAVDVGCAVVALDYRLAPEHRFPAGLDDCHLVLTWLVEHAEGLGLDPSRIAVGGLSAGGALAAGLAARLRDEDGPQVSLQLLLFPALDAGAGTVSARTFTDTPILTSRSVHSMWRMYLGGPFPDPDAEPPPYASPAHLPSVAGLPPVFLCTAEFDPLRDEAMRYAEQLVQGGVPVDFRLYARTFHSFDSFEAARLAQSARRDQVDALRGAFG